ncbi:BZ3500_MvSof-1268-A1-R1_Chr10-2g02967 [Microbotryum saponariae]|uniref:BZ3500_MvSof-1268-A1-R1_Chr10-2g02967 protein n=1 Tax=Microbotryum saponariae TaxID=289078 RepID=A0A2X0KZ28_9BASI|nr:BZ3501_MvSof-1269-A2-R1_Chr10-2g02553 [Microbotryum saponariae]SDA01837.1 BZ3500_MvSof-1268-A1-R1_Chr10-2g02967 [Microbotryum saponariae]
MCPYEPVVGMGAHLRTIPTTAVDQVEARSTPFSSSPVSTCDLLRSFTARAVGTDTVVEGPTNNATHLSPTEKEERNLKRHSPLLPKMDAHRRTSGGTSHESDDDDDEFVDASPTHHPDLAPPVATIPELWSTSVLSPIPGSASFDTPYGWHEAPASPSPKHPPSRLLQVDDWDAAYSAPIQDAAVSIIRSTPRSTARPRFSSVPESERGKAGSMKFEDGTASADVEGAPPVPAALPVEKSIKLRLRAQLAAKRAAIESSSGSSVKSDKSDISDISVSTKSTGSAAIVEVASKSGSTSSAPVETPGVRDITSTPPPEKLSINEHKGPRLSNDEVLAKMRAVNAAAGRHSGSTPTTPTREDSTGRNIFESPKTPSVGTRTRSATGLSPIYTGPPSVKSDSVNRDPTVTPGRLLARSTGSIVTTSGLEPPPKAASTTSSAASRIPSERDRKVARDIAILLGDDPGLFEGPTPSPAHLTQENVDEKKEPERAASMTESQRIRQEYQSSQELTSHDLDEPSSEVDGQKGADRQSKGLSLQEAPQEATGPASTGLPVIPALTPLSTSWSQSLFKATGRPASGEIFANPSRGSQAQSRSPSPAKRTVSPELAIRMSRFEALSTPPPASPVRGPSSLKPLEETVETPPRTTPLASSGAGVAKRSSGISRKETSNAVPSQAQVPLRIPETPSKIDPPSQSSRESPIKSADRSTPSSRVGSTKPTPASPGSGKSTPSGITKKRSFVYQATPFLGKGDVFGGSQKSLKDEPIDGPVRSASQHENSVIASSITGDHRPESLGSMKPLTGSIRRRVGSCSDASQFSKPPTVAGNRGRPRSNSGSTGTTGVLLCTNSEVERILRGENSQERAQPEAVKDFPKVDDSRLTHIDAFGRRLLPFEQRKVADDDNQTTTTRHAMETPADRLAWNQAKEAYSKEARNFRAYEACMHPLGTVRSSHEARFARTSRSKSAVLDQDRLDQLPNASLLPVKDTNIKTFKDMKGKEISTTPIKLPSSPLRGINATRDTPLVKQASKSSEAFGSNWSMQPSPSAQPVTPSRIIGRGHRGQYDARPLVTRMGDFAPTDRAVRDKSSPVQPVLVNGLTSRNPTTPDHKQGSPKVTWGSPANPVPFDHSPARSDPLAPNPINAFLENDRKLVEHAKARAKENGSMNPGAPTPPRPTVERKKFWGGVVKADESMHAQRWGTSRPGTIAPQTEGYTRLVDPLARSVATRAAPGEVVRTAADVTQTVEQLSGAVAREPDFDYGAVSAAIFELLQMVRETKNREIREAHKRQLERQVNGGLTAKERHEIESKRAEMARFEADRVKTAEEFKSVRYAIDTLAANEAKTQNLLTQMVKHIHSTKSTTLHPALTEEVQKLLGSVKAGVDDHIQEVKGELTQEVQRILKEVEELRDERRSLQNEIAGLMAFNVKQSLGAVDPSTTSRGPRSMAPTSKTGKLFEPSSSDKQVRVESTSPSHWGCCSTLIFRVDTQNPSDESPPSPPPSPQPQKLTAAGLGFGLFGPRMPRK